MTVHWNSRKGLDLGLNTASASDPEIGAEGGELTTAELLWAMRKVPNSRAPVLARARKLLADPDYPSDEVLRKVADLLARNMADSPPE